jgi:FKBP-type peptidyl-prolyl cis-trans isomerase SlyD
VIRARTAPERSRPLAGPFSFAHLVRGEGRAYLVPMQITKNSVVSFHYTLNDPDGQLLDTSAGREAFAYIQGHQMIVPGLERQLEGKKAGDKVLAVVPPAEGYGEIDPSLVHKVPVDRFGGQKVEAGMQFQAGSEQGDMGVFTVMAVEDGIVALNGNHPLAGVTLHFNVEITDVREATEEELSHGHVHGPGGHQH